VRTRPQQRNPSPITLSLTIRRHNRRSRKPIRIRRKSHRGSFVAAPLPIVSPAIGAGVIPVVGYIFALSEKDKVSPPSLVGAAGRWTDNGSNGFGVGTQLFMKENRYEIQALFADGTVNYTLFRPTTSDHCRAVALRIGEGMRRLKQSIPILLFGSASFSYSPPLAHRELAISGLCVPTRRNLSDRPSTILDLSHPEFGDDVCGLAVTNPY
jgi:hypothetical protein